jgi:hypothetical protein
MDREIISEAEATQVLKPHLSKVAECLETGWRQWEEWARVAPAKMSPRTRANAVYDFTVEHAKKVFVEDGAKLRVTEIPRFLLLTFDDRVSLRFKKLRTDLTSSGIATQQRIDYENQQLVLSGTAKPTLVVAGYLLDTLQAAVAEMIVTCSLRGQLMWSLPLHGTPGVTVLDHHRRVPPAPAVRSTLLPDPAREKELDGDDS